MPNVAGVPRAGAVSAPGAGTSGRVLGGAAVEPGWAIGIAGTAGGGWTVGFVSGTAGTGATPGGNGGTVAGSIVMLGGGRVVPVGGAGISMLGGGS
jgi:hypothetical protein